MKSVLARSAVAAVLVARLGCAGLLALGCVPAEKRSAAREPEEPARDAASTSQTVDSRVAGAESGAKAERPPESAPDAALVDTGSPLPMRHDGDVTPPSGDGLEQLLRSHALGLGFYHSCFIMPGRDLRCFNPDPGQPHDLRTKPPAGLLTDQIFGSHNGFCAVQPPGEPRLRCWGHNPSFFPPAEVSMRVDPLQIGIGYDHGCVLNKDHSVTCWGQPATMSTPPPGLRAKQLAVATFFNCAVREDGTVPAGACGRRSRRRG